MIQGVKRFHQVPDATTQNRFHQLQINQQLQYYSYCYYIGNLRYGHVKCLMSKQHFKRRVETPMYLEWPESMKELGFINEKEQEEQCIMSVRSMYGNVDAA